MRWPDTSPLKVSITCSRNKGLQTGPAPEPKNWQRKSANDLNLRRYPALSPVLLPFPVHLSIASGWWRRSAPELYIQPEENTLPLCNKRVYLYGVKVVWLALSIQQHHHLLSHVAIQVEVALVWILIPKQAGSYSARIGVFRFLNVHHTGNCA